MRARPTVPPPQVRRAFHPLSTSPHPSHEQTPPGRAGFCSLWKVTNADPKRCLNSLSACWFRSQAETGNRGLCPLASTLSLMAVHQTTCCHRGNRFDVVGLFGRKRSVERNFRTCFFKRPRGCLVEGALRIEMELRNERYNYARGATLLLLLLLIGALASVQARDGIERLDWQRFAIPRYGTTVLYPARIFAPVGEAEKGVGQRFESSNGRASLSIYSRDNSAGETPIAYLKNNMRVARAGLDYERVTRSFFAIFHGTGWIDLLQPMQLLERPSRSDSLFRSFISAGRGASLGPCCDANQSFA